jgi:hypothetical protein
MSVPVPVRVLLPAGTQVTWPTRPEDVERVMVLPRGTAVALADRRPGARGRLRRAAEHLGVRVEAEYVVLPTWGHATFVAADDPATMRWLLSTFTTTPPRVTRGTYLIEALQRATERASSTRAGAVVVQQVVGALVPGRLLIGTRR